MNASKEHANSVWVFGHNEITQPKLGVVGEMTNTFQLQTLCSKSGHKLLGVSDIYQLLGDLLTPLAEINYELANAGYSVIENFALAEKKAMEQVSKFQSADTFWVLSWSWNLAAFLALGLQRIKPVIAKLYVHHANERVLAPLYQPAQLLIVESLLAYNRGIECGIPPWKMIYLPHHYPECCDSLKSDRDLIEQLAFCQGKKLGKNTIIVGMVSRLIYGKNCEYALDVMRKIVASGEDVIFVLKGSFPPKTSFPRYQNWLSIHLERLKNEPWFIWDQTPTPFPEVLNLYAAFDICLHLSGAESGSNTIVEFLGLGKPIVLLAGSTNPSLFSGGVCFVNTEPELRPAPLPFHIPQMQDLEQKLLTLIRDSSARRNLSNKAKRCAEQRFHPVRSLSRFSLIMDAVHDQSGAMHSHLIQAIRNDNLIYSNGFGTD